MMAKKKKLNTKQKLWADYYLSNGFNKSLAARQAEYKCKSDAGFRKIGWENSTKPHIKEYIEKRLEDAAMGANEVLARLTSLAEGVDILDYIEQVETYAMDKAGKPYFAGYDNKVDFKRLQNDGYGDLIKKVRTTAQGTQLELQDSVQALIQLAKVHGLLIDKFQGEVDVKTTSTPEAVKALQAARKKLGGGG